MGIFLQTCLTETAANANSVNWPTEPTNQFSSKSIDPKHINLDAQIISHDHWTVFMIAHSSSTDVFYSPSNKPEHPLDLCMSWSCCCSAELPCSFWRLGFSPCRVPPSHYHIMWLRDVLVTAASLFLTWWQHDNLLIKVSGTPSTPTGPSYDFNVSKRKQRNTLISCASSFS